MSIAKLNSKIVPLADIKFFTEWFYYSGYLWQVIGVNERVYNMVICRNVYGKTISLDINTDVVVYYDKKIKKRRK